MKLSNRKMQSPMKKADETSDIGSIGVISIQFPNVLKT